MGALAYNFNTKEPFYGGERINWLTTGRMYLLDLIDKKKQKGVFEVTHYPGRGLLIPSDVFYKIGYYDEINFPQTMADYDFSLRAKRSGYKIFCNYDSILYIFPDDSASQLFQKNKSIKNYYRHLFGINGGGNLIYFAKFAIRNCPKQYLFPFLIIGLIKRIFGYPMNWFWVSFNIKK